MLKYAHIIPFYPLIQMIRVQYRYGIISNKKWPLVMVWFVKLVVLEPFRLVEAVVMVILPGKKVQPIFIIGYYRSGTTYLQELLASDKNHRTLTLFQSVLPEISLCFSWLFIPILSFITTLFRVKNKYHNIPFSWNFPGEEDVAINAMMCFHDYNRIYQYPSSYKMISERYLEFLHPADADKWLANYSYLLKKLAWKNPARQLVLKSPPNMGRIALLQKSFPGAKFIFIHRDPFECIPSSKRLWKLNRAFSFEEYSESEIEHILVSQYQSFYELFCAQDGHHICTGITFNDLVSDAARTLKFIYYKLGLTTWGRAARGVDLIQAKRKKETDPTKLQDLPVFLREAGSIKAIRTELGYT